MNILLSRRATYGLNALLRQKSPLSFQCYTTANSLTNSNIPKNGKTAASGAGTEQPYGAKSTALGDESGFLGNGDKNDWSKSYFGLSVEPFAKEVSDILLAPVDPLDVEMKPGRQSSPRPT
jgi:hypothetical protein